MMPYNIYPNVPKIELGDEILSLPVNISLVSEIELSKSIVERIRLGLENIGLNFVERSEFPISIKHIENEKFDYYNLKISKSGIVIQAVSGFAAFYALTTLLQILEQSDSRLFSYI